MIGVPASCWLSYVWGLKIVMIFLMVWHGLECYTLQLNMYTGFSIIICSKYEVSDQCPFGRWKIPQLLESSCTLCFQILLTSVYLLGSIIHVLWLPDIWWPMFDTTAYSHAFIIICRFRVDIIVPSNSHSFLFWSI